MENDALISLLLLVMVATVVVYRKFMVPTGQQKELVMLEEKQANDAKLKELEATLVELTNAMGEKSSEMDKIKSENHELKHSVDKVQKQKETEIALMQVELSSVQSKHTQLKSNLEMLEEKLDSEEKKQRELKQKFQQQHAASSKLHTEKAELLRQLRVAEQRNEDMTTQHAAELRRWNDMLRQERETLEKVRAERVAYTNNVQTRGHSLMQLVKAERAQQQQQIRDAEVIIAECNEHSAILTAQLDQERAQSHMLRMDLERAKEQAVRLSTKLDTEGPCCSHTSSGIKTTSMNNTSNHNTTAAAGGGAGGGGGPVVRSVAAQAAIKAGQHEDGDTRLAGLSASRIEHRAHGGDDSPPHRSFTPITTTDSLSIMNSTQSGAVRPKPKQTIFAKITNWVTTSTPEQPRTPSEEGDNNCDEDGWIHLDQ